MTNPIPFPARRVRRFAERLLISSATRERLSKPTWTNGPAREPLGNLLQRLALHRPVAVLLLESIVAEMLEQIDRQGPVSVVAFAVLLGTP